MSPLQIAIAGGLLAGGGLIVAVREFRPAPPDVRAALARLDAPPTSATLSAVPAGGMADRVGRWMVQQFDRPGSMIRVPRADLALLQRSSEALFYQKAVCAGIALLVAAVSYPLLVLVGFTSFAVPSGVGLLLVAGGFMLPTWSLRSDAAKARKQFREGLSAYLDLVSLTRVSGAGMNDAIEQPSQIANGWVFARIRTTLERGRLAGLTPWQALAELGQSVAVDELTDLAQIADLAAADQARVAEALAAKAASMRDAVLAGAKSDANARTEQLSVPLALLGVGFLILFGYPAVIRIVGS